MKTAIFLYVWFIIRRSSIDLACAHTAHHTTQNRQLRMNERIRMNEHTNMIFNKNETKQEKRRIKQPSYKLKLHTKFNANNVQKEHRKQNILFQFKCNRK